ISPRLRIFPKLRFVSLANKAGLANLEHRSPECFGPQDSTQVFHRNPFWKEFMRAIVRVISMAGVAGVLLLGSLFLTRPTVATSEQKPPRFGIVKKQIGLVPKEAATSAYLGAMAPDQQVRMLISFDVCDPEGLNRLLADLYDPSSPEFHHWLTPKQFGKRFGRSQQECEMGGSWVANQGFNVDIRYSSRLAMGFSGTADLIERAFHVQLAQYWDSEANRPFYSNLQEPTLPPEIAAFTADLFGLNDLVTYHKPVHVFQPSGYGEAGHARGQGQRPDGILKGPTFLSPATLTFLTNSPSLT